MSIFQIGGSLFRPTNGVTNSKKPEKKPEEKDVELSKSAYDSVKFRDNPLAAMPRMSTVSGESAQRMRGETVESLLKDSATELDDYFSKAYGFKE